MIDDRQRTRGTVGPTREAPRPAAATASAAGPLLLLHVAFLLTLWPALIVLITTTGLILDRSWLAASVPAAAGIAVLAGDRLFRDEGLPRRRRLIGLALAGAVAVAAFAFAGRFYDQSWDGQWYQQTAVLELARGWNPVAPLLGGEARLMEPGADTRLWLSHYPKTSWLLGAAIFELTGNVEAAKGWDFILLAVAGLLAAYAFMAVARLPRTTAGLLAAATALNPVVIYQSLSSYVDGLLASLLTATLVVLVLLLLRPRPAIVLLASAVVILLINVKFTGAVLAALLLLAWGVAALVRFGLAGGIVRSLPLAAAALLGLLYVGASSYVPNTLLHGHPFHPLMGADPVDIITKNTPAAFRELDRVSALAASVFARSDIGFAGYTFQWPFTPPDPAELDELIWSDPRMGGWGAMFGGLVVLGGLTLPAALAWCRRDPVALGLVGLAGLVLATVLVHPAPWWARYVPQLWLVPILLFAVWFRFDHRPARWLGLACVLFALVNSGLVIARYYPNHAVISRGVTESLARLAATDDRHAIYFADLGAIAHRFRTAGIHFERVAEEAELPCAEPERWERNGNVQICRIGAEEPAPEPLAAAPASR